VKGFRNAIELNGGLHSITNLGEVHGGIKLIGDNGEISNGGVVEEGRIRLVGDLGVIYNDGLASRGITSTGESNDVTNLGEVRGGIRLIGDNGQILNGGEIRRSEVGVAIEGNSNTFVNDGYMETDLLGLSVAGTDNELTNRDRITGGTIGVEFATVDGETNTLTNSGIIRTENDLGPAVVGGDGDEVIVNTFIIFGEVLLNGGNDVYDGRDAYLPQWEYDEYGETLWTYPNPGTVDGGLGDDDLTGTRYRDTLLGGGGDDIIRGARGSDHLQGGSGYDVLIGGVGSDTIEGNGGNDRLAGRAGDDILTGGKGADTFVFGTSYNIRSSADDKDRITDFEDGTDKIDLSKFGTDFSAVADAIDGNMQGDARISLYQLGGEGIIIVEGTSSAQLDASDFIL